jgi:hypothetical protein
MVPPFDESATEQILQAFSARLKETTIPMVDSVEIRGALVPILTFRTKMGGISVDLSVNNQAGPSVLSYVYDWLRGLPSLRALTLTLKLFLHDRGLDSLYTGGVGGYAMLTYVRSFLKRNPAFARMECVGEALISMFCELSNVGLWSAIGIACDGSLIEKSRLLEHCAREGKPDPFWVVVDPANPGKWQIDLSALLTYIAHREQPYCRELPS